MKTLLCFFGIILLGFTDVDGQEALQKNSLGLVEYSEVVLVDSATKDQIYSAARVWFVENFNDAKEVLQVQDKDNGELIGKGVYNIPSKRFGYMAIGIGLVTFQVTVLIKDGKYKYVFSNFSHEGGLRQIPDCGSLDDEVPNKGCSNSLFQEIKSKTAVQVVEMISSLKYTISKGVQNKSSDW